MGAPDGRFTGRVAIRLVASDASLCSRGFSPGRRAFALPRASLRRSRAVDGVAEPPEEDAASRARFTRSHPRAMSSPETGKKLAGDRCAPEPPGTKMTTARPHETNKQKQPTSSPPRVRPSPSRERRVYSCAFCRTHAAYHDDIISKAFQGRHGRAFLMNEVCNVTLGVHEERLLMTGMHTVRDVFCSGCGSLMGWQYVRAHDASQRYKEGKFIVEKAMVLHEGGW